jgi:hypothetical protein
MRQNGQNTITVEVDTYCGTSAGYGEFFWACGYRMAAPNSNVELYPNPARDMVNIRIKDANAQSLPKGQVSIEVKDVPNTGSAAIVQDIREVKVFDKLGTVKKLYKFPAGSKIVTLNITGLPTDIYFVEVSDGKNKARLQLSVTK